MKKQNNNEFNQMILEPIVEFLQNHYGMKSTIQSEGHLNNASVNALLYGQKDDKLLRILMEIAKGSTEKEFHELMMNISIKIYEIAENYGDEYSNLHAAKTKCNKHNKK